MDLNFKVKQMKQNILFILILLMIVSCGENGGVAPGESTSTKYRIFASLANTNGGIGVNGFDNICNTDLNNPNDGSTFKALVGSATRNKNSADWPLKASTTYYTTDMQVITTTDTNAIFTFPLTTAIELRGINNVLTGLDDDMNVVTNCSDWTSSSLAKATFGQGGEPSLTNSYAINYGALLCNQLHYVYCVEQ